jgi:hypothetical protein
MTANEIKLLRPLVESICEMSDGLSKSFLDAAMDGLETVFESSEDKAASTWAAASKATADIWNIDKNINAKVAKLGEKKQAIETNLATKQAENA